MFQTWEKRERKLFCLLLIMPHSRLSTHICLHGLSHHMWFLIWKDSSSNFSAFLSCSVVSESTLWLKQHFPISSLFISWLLNLRFLPITFYYKAAENFLTFIIIFIIFRRIPQRLICLWNLLSWSSLMYLTEEKTL